MSSLYQVGVAVLLVMLTLCLQSAGIAALLAGIRRATKGFMDKLGPFRVAALFIRVMAAMIALHILEILLWASCYRWLCFRHGGLPRTFPQAAMRPPATAMWCYRQRGECLGRSKSVVGVLMSGFSASFLFAIATRLIRRDGH